MLQLRIKLGQTQIASGPLSTCRNDVVLTRDPGVGPSGLKRTSQNLENLSYNAPYQNFQCRTGPLGRPPLAAGDVVGPHVQLAVVVDARPRPGGLRPAQGGGFTGRRRPKRWACRANKELYTEEPGTVFCIL